MKYHIKNRTKPAPRKTRGVTLIEMMVAILVLSIGMLGIAGLQAATSKYKINTWARSSASTLLSDLSERVRINPDAAGTSFASEGVTATSEYVVDETWATQQSNALTISKNCEAAACTSSERATYDLLIWRQRVRQSMPLGAALVSGDRRNGLDIALMWFDKEQVDDPNSASAALVKAPVCDGTEAGMAQQTCCPSEASAPAGVRCARFTFVP
ncbi:type IV pilus modification protein PilV [Acidovorax radicis]|jgi:type IV pilus assembly protein PilV|uniref:type IV pilus modification protein PilV n=1 Tax=Acidovorax radicis TaxID=758826 RepID=UPI001CFBAD4C|nr:type IV pilus modification protein PilV [Acidovorax radicis]UCV00608.1 type IV pilus modification protein PilV [Acidovorax radicis]